MSAPVIINILDKEYQISCPEAQRESLIASADMLHKNMEVIKNAGKVVGLDRIAVMAALNIAHDLIILQNNKDNDGDVLNKKLLQIKDKVISFLQEDWQIEA